MCCVLKGGSDSGSSKSLADGAGEEATMGWFADKVAESEPKGPDARRESSEVQVRLTNEQLCRAFTNFRPPPRFPRRPEIDTFILLLFDGKRC